MPINDNQCNHVIHYEDIFDELSSDLFKITLAHRNWFYRHIPEMRESGTRISFGIELRCGFYFEIREPPEELTGLVSSIVEFVEHYMFDGVAITVVDDKCTPTIDEYGTEFLRQLSESFKPRGLLLTISATRNVLVHPDIQLKKLSK